MATLSRSNYASQPDARVSISSSDSEAGLGACARFLARLAGPTAVPSSGAE